VNEQIVVEKKRKKNPSPPPRGAGRQKKLSRRYSPEAKLKAVRPRLEEGLVSFLNMEIALPRAQVWCIGWGFEQLLRAAWETSLTYLR
jgi:hypothetical protein